MASSRILDASFFVSASAIDPSRTIIANAIRIAGHRPDKPLT